MSEDLPPPELPFPDAKVRKRHFSAVWLIPILAAFITGFLGVRAYSEKGPVVTISFRTAEGLSVGQTAVKYKSVALGTVESVTLKPDLSGVSVRVRMASHSDAVLTDHASFWVERPRLVTTNISDIVSGTYIQVDPGTPGGSYKTDFEGLENQPALPADEPGTTFTIKADRLGAITESSPVYYRDIVVGKVLGYEMGDGFGPITVNLFVHSPYDKLVKPSSRFWNASGLYVKLGAGGLHLELQSLQSLLNGGLAFSTPPGDVNAAQAGTATEFQLFENRKAADAATHGKHVSYVTYVKNSVKDLAPGSPVQIFGIQVGEVTGVKLVIDPTGSNAQVRVAFEIEPDRAFGADTPADTKTIMRQLVQNGMRVKMESSDLIAGQEILSLEFVPRTEQAEIAMEGDAIVLPGNGAGIESLAGAVSDIVAKLNQIPFEEIGKNLNHLLASADQTIGGPDMHQAVHSLAITMANAKDISIKANENLTPALQRLPDISAQLQTAVAQANDFMASVNTGYGQNSDFQRNSKHVLDQVNDAARSIRLLADFLERHPEALLQGKGTPKVPESDKP